MELINHTPFVADRVAHVDGHGREVLVVILKCTYAIGSGGRLAPSDEQLPLRLADEFHGEPAASSVRYESDLAPVKPGTDVVLIGHAYAPGGRATRTQVSLRVGGLHHVIAVVGDRHWRRWRGASAPAPFEHMPLVYERAFGGQDVSAGDPRHHEHEARNPVGRGFRARKSRLDLEQLPLPNLELPGQPLRSPDERPEPAAFGFVARHWQPRARYAGTMDDAWHTARAPLAPLDFDDRYHNGAPHGLVAAPHLAGEEEIEVLNASTLGPLRTRLRGERPAARVTLGREEHDVPLVLDTLVLEPDERRLVLVWRGRRTLGPDMYRVRTIAVAGEA